MSADAVIILLVALLAAGTLLAARAGIRSIQQARKVVFYRTRRSYMLAGWQWLVLALVLFSSTMASALFGEPVANQLFPSVSTQVVIPPAASLMASPEKIVSPLAFTPTQTGHTSQAPTDPATVTQTLTPSQAVTLTVTGSSTPKNPSPTADLSSLATHAAETLKAQLAIIELSNTPTQTKTATITPSFTPTSTATLTETPTSTRNPNFTATPMPTRTPVPSKTPSPTRTPRPTLTYTSTTINTLTQTATVTQTLTFTPSATPTMTPTMTSTRTPLLTWTPSSTLTFTSTSTRTATSTVTLTASLTLTPSSTPTMTPTRTPRPTLTPTATRTLRPTATFTFTPSRTPSPTRTPMYTKVNVYFTDNKRLIAGQLPYEVSVSRFVLSSKNRVASVLDEFFKGPSDVERNKGLGRVLNGFTGYSKLVLANGGVQVYLAGNCQSNGTLYNIARLLMVNIKQFPEIQFVKIYDQLGHTREPAARVDSIPACLDPTFTPSATPLPTSTLASTFRKTPTPLWTVRPFFTQTPVR